MLKKSLTGLLILLSTLAFSQVQLRITLKDGNIVSGSAALSKISLTTEYGKLEIPIKNVSGIKMGVKQEDGETTKTVDIVEIDYTYNMGGQTDLKAFDIKTEYGALSIPREKVENIEVYILANGQTTFKLLGSKHISGNASGGWLNTGILVKSGQAITISAIGQVTLASLSGQKYTADGKLVGSTVAATDDYGYEGGEGSYPTYGNIVFKIGDQGTMLKAGDKFNGTATETGIFFLSIYETVYSASNTGGYIVKVEIK
jgi:hypothetical protein